MKPKLALQNDFNNGQILSQKDYEEREIRIKMETLLQQFYRNKKL